MRRAVTALVALLLIATVARAGLYVPGESNDFVPSNGKVVAQPLDQFRLRLNELRAISFDPKSVPAGGSPMQATELRRQTLAKRQELAARLQRLKVDELNQLGAYDYRLRDYDGAVTAWQLAKSAAPRDFAAYSHLALVKLASNNLEEARNDDSAAGDLMRGNLPGMSAEQSTWYVSVEKMLRKIIRARLLEQRQRVPPEKLLPDDLFGVQFIGENGEYVSGQIAAAQKEKLPDDAIAIVQQLLLWLPNDGRLCWLLAELYNASGDPAAALLLMNKECIESRGYRPDLLRDHVRILSEHLAKLDADAKAAEEAQARDKKRMFWITVIVGGLLVAGLVGWQVNIYVRRFGRRA